MKFVKSGKLFGKLLPVDNLESPVITKNETFKVRVNKAPAVVSDFHSNHILKKIRKVNEIILQDQLF